MNGLGLVAIAQIVIDCIVGFLAYRLYETRDEIRELRRELRDAQRRLTP